MLGKKVKSVMVERRRGESHDGGKVVRYEEEELEDVEGVRCCSL